MADDRAPFAFGIVGALTLAGRRTIGKAVIALAVVACQRQGASSTLPDAGPSPPSASLSQVPAAALSQDSSGGGMASNDGEGGAHEPLSGDVPDAEVSVGTGVPQQPGPLPHAVPVGPVPTVISGIEMSVPVDNAESVIRSRIEPAAKRCYRLELRKNSSEAGTFNLLLRVLPDGRVDSITITANSGLSAGLVDCVAPVARSVSFHAPGGMGSVISVGLTFATRPLSGLELNRIRSGSLDMPSRRPNP
jgi:hypothetical protein